MTRKKSYLMESEEESIRLEIKTDPEILRKQARWCGIKPGIHVLDAGCGPGKTTSVLCELSQPGGTVLGLDYSEERIRYAHEHYGGKPEVDFQVHDLRDPLDDYGMFDLILVRFVLEYNRAESADIVANLTACLKPGGRLCLMDLDHNCLNHYELSPKMEQIFSKLKELFEKSFNFDPFAGRKLYAYLYDLGYEEIKLDLIAHHLFYGEITEQDMYNWIKKFEIVSARAKGAFKEYPGGHDGFFDDYKRFFLSPRRFTYTPLILCRGIKPLTSKNR